VKEYQATLLYRPEKDSLRFLPEGPYPVGENQFSWISIQHGKNETTGSLNILDLSHSENKNWPLKGRPGFAFPTDQKNIFVIGLERDIILFNIETGDIEKLAGPVDESVSNTIINDGICFDEGLIFGCKELSFTNPVAGLYYFRSRDRKLFLLRDDQTCSNGKILIGSGTKRTLLDIDTPTKKVVSYQIDLEEGSLSDPETILDLNNVESFPDGMITTPDGKSVIIAFFNPNPANEGEARQYSIETGNLETVWKLEHSPQVTCPQLINLDGEIKLVLTTAVENMSEVQKLNSTNAGCLFLANTDFNSLPDQPVYHIQ
jgi:sugar lactone lactonase YvrE